MKIQRFKQSDKGSLMAIIKGNVPKYFHPDELIDYAKYLKEEVEDYYVVVDEGEIIGAGGLNELKCEVRLSWIVIDCYCHGKGVGTELVKFLLTRAFELKKEGQPIIVRTAQYTDKFFEKLGFETVEICKDYWAKGIDLVRMRWK